jgi:hypothetical protein
MVRKFCQIRPQKATPRSRLGVKKPLFGQGSTRVYLKKIPKKFRRAEAAAVRVYKVN